MGVTITPPTSAAGGLTTYVVSFTTSSTGALDGNAGSTVTIALPANTGLGSFHDGGTSTLDVGGTQVGYCDATDTSASTPTVTCYSTSGDTVECLDPGHGHPQRGDQSAGRPTHPGCVDHLGRHPGDLARLHGDRGPGSQPAGRLLVQSGRRSTSTYGSPSRPRRPVPWRDAGSAVTIAFPAGNGPLGRSDGHRWTRGDPGRRTAPMAVLNDCDLQRLQQCDGGCGDHS